MIEFNKFDKERANFYIESYRKEASAKTLKLYRLSLYLASRACPSHQISRK